MSRISGYLTRICRAFRRHSHDRDMAAEMRDHIEHETARRIAMGEDPATARRRAAAEFGSIDARTEEVRDARLGVWLEQIWQDFVFASRKLRKSPGFTTVAVLTLAIGIGANAAIFSVVNAMLLRSLPVPHPEQLRILQWTGQEVSIPSFTGSSSMVNGQRQADAFPHPTFEDFRAGAESLGEVFGCFPLGNQTTMAAGTVGFSDVMMVSDNYFTGMQQSAQIGRVFEPTDDLPNSEPVAIITHGLWQTRFDSDYGILGQSISIDRNKFVIVGVLPPEHASPFPGNRFDVYVPLAAKSVLRPSRTMRSYDNWWVRLMVRLRTGHTDEQLGEVLQPLLASAFEQSRSRADSSDILIKDGRSGIVPAREFLTSRLLALQGVVAVILLIACANLAGLLLARATVRRHEFAICAAIGAQRSRLIRRLMVESLLLAVAGGLCGLALDELIKNGLMANFHGAQLGPELDLGIDRNVLWFAGGITIATAVLCGLLPAFRASRTDLVTDLKLGNSSNFIRHRWGSALVAIQIALSVLLVTGAGLFMRSFGNLNAIDPGFDATNTLVFRLNANQEGYTDEQHLDFFDQVRSNLIKLPSVASVSASSVRLLQGSMSSSGFSIPGQELQHGERWQAHTMVVADEYFKTLNIGVQNGRTFGPQDNRETEAVMVINALIAEYCFPNQNPVGQILRMDGRNFRIIGVCSPTLYDAVRQPPPMTLFTSARQQSLRSMDFYVRTSLPATAIVDEVRQTIVNLDPTIPLANISTLEAQFDGSISTERSMMMLFGSLAGLAILLSCIGLYGLMAYSMAQRRAEIGIRMALGALPADISRKVLSDSLRLAAWGLGIGLPLAIGLGFAARAAFFDIAPYDPVTLIGTVLALAFAATVAVWIPARRAARIDVLTALRAE